MSDAPVGVVGASARAAVMTLARAGRTCWAIDLFNDRDLKRIAPCARCSFQDFPHAIPALARRFPPGPVLLAGGMENHPDTIEELARDRDILGPSADVVRQVRNPSIASSRPSSRSRQRPETLLAGSTVPRCGPHAPRAGSQPEANGSDPDASAIAPHAERADHTVGWLIKSLRSAGGLGVRHAVPGEIVPPGHVAQEFLAGPVMSAAFHNGERLGVTEQLVGIPWLHAAEFHYAGTIAPAEFHGELTPPARAGYHGVDFILNDGVPRVIEINPRYPASVEAIEFANRLRRVVGKAIWFAPHAFRFPAAGPWDANLVGPFDPWRLPNFADIPEPGEPFEPGHPVITFFATGSTADDVRERLQSQAEALDRLLEPEGRSEHLSPLL